MIVIIDYGMGNIHSVKKALELMGEKAHVSCKADEIKKAQKVVFPGVGSFGDAMQELNKNGLTGALQEHIRNKKTYLGICLGMQVLFEKSQEARGVAGLGLLKGEVKKFTAGPGLKVPHMGWNQLKKVSAVLCQVSEGCPLLKGIPDNSYVYFCHSYYPQPLDETVIAATTDYGSGFASLVWQDNIYGVQFHPEKSQGIGLAMLKNFVEL